MVFQNNTYELYWPFTVQTEIHIGLIYVLKWLSYKDYSFMATICSYSDGWYSLVMSASVQLLVAVQSSNVTSSGMNLHMQDHIIKYYH